MPASRSVTAFFALGSMMLASAAVLDANAPAAEDSPMDSLGTQSGDNYVGQGGCYKGYCWAGCETRLGGPEWCYTTKTYSQSYSYVKCSRDSQCDNTWKCGGPCAAI